MGVRPALPLVAERLETRMRAVVIAERATVSLREGAIEAARDAIHKERHTGEPHESRCDELGAVSVDAILDYLQVNADELTENEDVWFAYQILGRVIAALRIQENQP